MYYPFGRCHCFFFIRCCPFCFIDKYEKEKKPLFLLTGSILSQIFMGRVCSWPRVWDDGDIEGENVKLISFARAKNKEWSAPVKWNLGQANVERTSAFSLFASYVFHVRSCNCLLGLCIGSSQPSVRFSTIDREGRHTIASIDTNQSSSVH